MSEDFQMLKPCPHVNGKYLSNNCPICNGTNFYLDLVLTQSGQPKLASGLTKTIQEIIHIFLTDIGLFEDYSYPEYGSNLTKFIGAKNTTENILKFQVLRDLNYLNYLKEKQQELYGNVDSSEVIREIVSIKLINEEDSQSIELACLIGDSDVIQYFPIKQFTF